MTLTSNECFAKLGDPKDESQMMSWAVSSNLWFAPLPKKIYCSKQLPPVLSIALKNVIERKLIGQIKTWDGCFNIRSKKGSNTFSLHSWGVAFDINAKTNGFDEEPTMSPELVKCFTDAGFEWGGSWRRKDGMHFQLKTIVKA